MRTSTRSSLPWCQQDHDQACEQVFGVKVTGVNTNNREGKRVRTRYGWGRRTHKARDCRLQAGDRIDIFEDRSPTGELTR